MSESDALREFAARDRSAVERLKRRYWTERYRQVGAAGAIAASRALWAHAKAVCPEWPTEQVRAEDLAAHVEQKRRIDRAAHAFTVR